MEQILPESIKGFNGEVIGTAEWSTKMLPTEYKQVAESYFTDPAIETNWLGMLEIWPDEWMENDFFYHLVDKRFYKCGSLTPIQHFFNRTLPNELVVTIEESRVVGWDIESGIPWVIIELPNNELKAKQVAVAPMVICVACTQPVDDEWRSSSVLTIHLLTRYVRHTAPKPVNPLKVKKS